MNWFRKKKKVEANPILNAPTDGTWVEQSDLPDPMFAQGMMGEAFGIDSSSGIVEAPFDGTVTMTFPTGHALGLRRSDGLEFLIHIGVDTVNLRGEGFEMQVSDNQPVKAGQTLVRFDPDGIRGHGLNPTVICAFTSPIASKEALAHGNSVAAGTPIYTIIAGEPED